MLAALLAALLLAQAPAGWRAGGRAFGSTAEVEVRGVDAATAERSLRAALDRLVSAQAEIADATARLNAASGGEPVPLAADALALLERALDFCLWSAGAHGPVGGRLYELWHGALPTAPGLTAAVGSAGCDRLSVDRQAGTAMIAAGSRLDLRGFAAGWAVDRAVDALRDNGVGNGRVRLGAIRRGFGPGPEGRGWRVPIELPGAGAEPLKPIMLRDRALAPATREPTLVIAGERYAPHLNQRTGRPAEGVVATVAVSELAVDAQALAVTMFVTGQREGMMRLGGLRPQPSVLWLLGSGDGPPLRSSHRWAAVSDR